MGARMFPIQSDHRVTKPHPTSIPWSVADLAYSIYAAQYGRSQSLERLAERGGFGAGEMDMFLPDWRDRCSEVAALKAELAEAVSENEDHRRTMFIPGAQACPVCKFSLQKMVMRAIDGAVGVNTDAPLEECPNGCGFLIGVTYEQGWSEMIKAAEDHAKGRADAEAAIERVRNNWPHIEVQAGRYFTDKRTADPGAPTCLRCKLEALLAPPPAEGPKG